MNYIYARKSLKMHVSSLRGRELDTTDLPGTVGLNKTNQLLTTFKKALSCIGQ